MSWRVAAFPATRKYLRFTGESFAGAIYRTIELDIVYDDLGRPSEWGGKADTVFLGRPRAELSLVESRYQMNMRNARNKANTLRDLGLSQNTAVVGDLIWALAGWQTLYSSRFPDGWRDLEEATPWRSKNGEYLFY